MTVEELLQNVNGTRLTEPRLNILVKVASKSKHPALIKAQSISDCVSWLLDDINDDTPYDYYGLDIYQNVRNLIKWKYLNVAEINEQPFVSIADLGLAYLVHHKVISNRLFETCLKEGVSQSFKIISSETQKDLLELEMILPKLLKLERSPHVQSYFDLASRCKYLQQKVNNET